MISIEKLQDFFIYTSLKEQTLFAKRLSFLLQAEIPLLESLIILRSQTRSKAKIKILDVVVADVSSGQFLYTSFSKHRTLFGDFAINLIRVGEYSGTLSANLSYLADELKKKQVLKSKIIGALLYPICITVGTIGLTALLIIYVFPKILPIFTSLHVSLPMSTRMVIGLSQFLATFGVWCLFLMLFLIGFFLFARTKWDIVHRWEDKTVLTIPLVRHMIRSYNLANFCRTLKLLLVSGMHLSEALLVVAEVTKNVLYKNLYIELAQSVQKGETISRSLESYENLFPDMTRHLIAVGERAGTLVASLQYICDFHEGEIEEQTKQLTAAVEPVLMVTMGLSVGFVAVAVITPMYEITSRLTPQ